MATKKAAVPSASKLKALQTKLNKDKALRAKFLKDPGETLRSQGVEIDEDKATEIAKYMGKMTAPQRAQFQAELARIRVGVSVRIRIRVNVGITL